MRIRTPLWATKNSVYGDAFAIIEADVRDFRTTQKVKTKRKKAR
jgi:hypothetical protein